MRLGSSPVPSGSRQLSLTHPSPNCGPRRDGAVPDLVVIHYTAMQTAEAACQTLCNPDTEVSAHYLIAEDGTVMSLVPEDLRAWHAGAGSWGGISDVNSRSIGIELANSGFSPFSHSLMESLIALLGDLRSRWSIPPERIIGHSDMAPGRKIDPGLRFDWRRLALEGQGIWPRYVGAVAADVNEDVFRRAACAFGYPEMDHDLCLATVRRRFRPWAVGPLDRVDMAIITDLAARFPVDAKPATT